MDPQRLKRLSKRLALILRHRPESVGLTLEARGWVDVDRLLAALAASGTTLTKDELDRVVEENDKRRYAFDESGSKIRASQGHSVSIDLGLQPQAPPVTLYHGTSPEAVDAILAHGIVKMSRHAVHLSTDVATALKVAARRGKPVVLQIDAQAMTADGFPFFRSDNGVWLTDHVPPSYIVLLSA